MQMNIPGTLESRMRGNVQVRFGGGLSEKGGNVPRREPTQPFKRAAVKFGVGRYLYRDGVPAFARERAPALAAPLAPEVPAQAAAPEPASLAPVSAPARTSSGNSSVPRSGRALFAWTKDQEQRHEVGLLKYLNGWAKLQDYPGRMVDWDADQVSQAYAEACRKLQSISTGQSEVYEEALAN